MKPTLIVTAGDPAGIGAEITMKALKDAQLRARAKLIVVADGFVLQKAAEIVSSQLQLREIQTPSQATGECGVLEYIDAHALAQDAHVYSQVRAACGHAAFEYVKTGIEICLRGEAAGVVTCPINKEALHLAGHDFAGHTEIFAKLTHTDKYAMMLAHGALRVAHVTTHVSLRRACELVKKQRVLDVIELTNNALTAMGIEHPRIAVAALNPHASEGGLFGDEEAREIMPAVADSRAKGMLADGPLPPDTVFVKALGGSYDAVVAMYHDQGHIPLKLYGFHADPATGTFTSVNGVNITLGLPIIRTSVDHGTAFDLAGKGIASEESLTDAIQLAATMAAGRRA